MQDLPSHRVSIIGRNDSRREAESRITPAAETGGEVDVIIDNRGTTVAFGAPAMRSCCIEAHKQSQACTLPAQIQREWHDRQPRRWLGGTNRPAVWGTWQDEVREGGIGMGKLTYLDACFARQ